MSASMNTQVFKSYLNNCPVIRVKGRQFDVKHHFLEDFIQESELRVKMPNKLRHKLKLELNDLPEDYKDEFGHELGNLLRSIENINVGNFNSLNVLFTVTHTVYEETKWVKF